MMVDKIASSAAKMQNDAIEDKTLPIVAVIDKLEKYKVHVRTAPSKDVSDGINDLLSGDFVGRQKSLIGVALNEFLDNGSSGETNHSPPPQGVLLRLDYMMYKYCGRLLNNFLYGGASPRSPTPYPFIYHISRKRYPFVCLLQALSRF